MRWMLCVMLAGCGMFGEDDTGLTGDGCADHTVTEWWPIDVDQTVYEPGDIVTFQHTAGGRDATGIGLVLPTEVVWDGVTYDSGVPEWAELGMPMEPGTYPMRVQTQVCADYGLDFELTVAYPEPRAEVALPDVVDDDSLGQGVAFSRDGSELVAVVYDEVAEHTRMVWLDPATGAGLRAFDMEEASAHLMYSPDGEWFAQGPSLYRRENGGWFLVTHFQGEEIHFSDAVDTAWLDRRDDGLVTRIDLQTGERTELFYGVGLQEVTSDGFFRTGNELVDAAADWHPISEFPDTYVYLWDPARQLAMTSHSGSDTAWIDIFGNNPVGRLVEGECRPPYRDWTIALHPSGEFLLAYGASQADDTINNPWYVTCDLDSGWTRVWPAQPVPFENGWDAVYRRVFDAAWSPDGTTLALAGLRGVHVIDWPVSED